MNHYRVRASATDPGCIHCGAGTYWTVVYDDASGEECEIGQAWVDRDTADDACDLMNMAYEAGKQAA